MPGIGMTVANTAALMAIEKVLLSILEDKTSENWQAHFDRLHSDIMILRQAPMLDALDLKEEDDLDGYKTALMQAKNRDVFNMHARILYAEELVRRGKHTIAAKIFQECLSWYGPNCPAIPTAIREAYAPYQGIRLSGLPGLNATINCRTNERDKLIGVAISGAGLLVAWHFSTGFLLTHKAKTLLTFKPWTNGSSSAPTIFLSEAQGQKMPPIHLMTDRFLVHSLTTDYGYEVIDLLNPNDRRIMSPAQIEIIFGKIKNPANGFFARSAQYGIMRPAKESQPLIEHRGVRLEIGSHSWEEFPVRRSKETIYGPRITATPLLLEPPQNVPQREHTRSE